MWNKWRIKNHTRPKREYVFLLCIENEIIGAYKTQEKAYNKIPKEEHDIITQQPINDEKVKYHITYRNTREQKTYTIKRLVIE